MSFLAVELHFLVLWAELLQVNVSTNLASDEVKAELKLTRLHLLIKIARYLNIPTLSLGLLVDVENNHSTPLPLKGRNCALWSIRLNQTCVAGLVWFLGTPLVKGAISRGDFAAYGSSRLSTRPFWTYREVRFTRSQIYLLFDVSAIQKLKISSVRVWSLAKPRNNRLKSPFSCYYRKNICVRLRVITKFQLC